MSDSISESVILSTCNRTEIYSYASDPEEIVSWYAQFRGFSQQELSSVLYQNSGELVARHAFRVASVLIQWCSVRHKFSVN